MSSEFGRLVDTWTVDDWGELFEFYIYGWMGREAHMKM